MSKYEEKITDNSLWYTATPTPLTLTLPFYITEAGHFRAEADYKVERDEHDSYLLLYTIKGSGTVVSDKVSLAALPHNAVMIIVIIIINTFQITKNGNLYGFI